MTNTLVEFPHNGGPVREAGLEVIIGWSDYQHVWQLQSWNGWKIANSPEKRELLDYIKQHGFVLLKDYN